MFTYSVLNFFLFTGLSNNLFLEANISGVIEKVFMVPRGEGLVTGVAGGGDNKKSLPWDDSRNNSSKSTLSNNDVIRAMMMSVTVYSTV
jgi:hypothetical protein